MAHLVLDQALEGVSHVKKDGATYHFSDDTETTAFIALGHEVLQIQRLGAVEAHATQMTLKTHKGERFVFPLDFLIGFKFGAVNQPTRTNAGFSK